MTIVLPDREQVVAKGPKAADAAPLANGAGPGAGAQDSSAALPPIDEKTQYRAQPGESLYKISQKLYGKADKVDAIYNLNKDAIGPNPSRLRAGTVLKLPEPPTAPATAAR
jgi:nucleoid-associated protein YgaU